MSATLLWTLGRYLAAAAVGALFLWRLWAAPHIAALELERARSAQAAAVEHNQFVEQSHSIEGIKFVASHEVEVKYVEAQKQRDAVIAQFSAINDGLQRDLAARTTQIDGAGLPQDSPALTAARQESAACWHLVESGVRLVTGCATDAESLRIQVQGLLADARSVCRGDVKAGSSE